MFMLKVRLFLDRLLKKQFAFSDQSKRIQYAEQACAGDAEVLYPDAVLSPCLPLLLALALIKW